MTTADTSFNQKYSGKKNTLIIDKSTRKFSLNNTITGKLPACDFEILTKLAENKQRKVSFEDFGYSNNSALRDPLKQAIKRLRIALKDDKKKIIETLYAEGYVLNIDVVECIE